MEKIEVVKHLLRHTNHGSFVNNENGKAWAPSNIALCKYWGKRDIELNLPVNSSLSLALGNKGSYTSVKQEGTEDSYLVNDVKIASTSAFAVRLKKFLDLFRPHHAFYRVEITINLPIAAGMASSACGFAALVLALNNLYDWHLTKTDLSILARLGSGSACRSLWEGFVLWSAGDEINGMDSHGLPLPYLWPEIRLGSLIISNAKKSISSTEGMQRTVATSPVYENWPTQAANDLAKLQLALTNHNFELLGKTSEENALAMHETAFQANPPIVYSQAETFLAREKVWGLRQKNIPVFFTQDAGPNLQLLFLANSETEVIQTFPEIEIVLPFADPSSQQLILVDEHDVEIGVGEKLAIHLQGKLHRAYSVFIFREKDNKLELLLQQRSPQKYHSANLWTNTCCGHPKPGEKIIAAAEQRLKEEMGFTSALQEIGSFHYRTQLAESNLIENEIDHVLVGRCNPEHFAFNPQEVQDFRWVNINELLTDLAINPNQYTVWFTPALFLILQSLDIS